MFFCWPPLAFACGTDAVGVDACRDIEFARCEAAQACDMDVDVDACQRFARDNCLRGLAGDTPGDTAVQACVNALEAVVECADRLGAKAKANSCDENVLASAGSARVCSLVLEPASLAACRFLRAPNDDGEGDETNASSDPKDQDASTGGPSDDAKQDAASTSRPPSKQLDSGTLDGGLDGARAG